MRPFLDEDFLLVTQAARALFPSDEASKALTPPLSRTSRAEADSHLAVPGGRASPYGGYSGTGLTDQPRSLG